MVSLQRIQEHLSHVVQHLFHIYDRKSRPRRIWPAARFSIAELQIKLDVSHHERVGVERLFPARPFGGSDWNFCKRSKLSGKFMFLIPSQERDRSIPSKRARLSFKITDRER